MTFLEVSTLTLMEFITCFFPHFWDNVKIITFGGCIFKVFSKWPRGVQGHLKAVDFVFIWSHFFHIPSNFLFGLIAFFLKALVPTCKIWDKYHLLLLRFVQSYFCLKKPKQYFGQLLTFRFLSSFMFIILTSLLLSLLSFYRRWTDITHPCC